MFRHSTHIPAHAGARRGTHRFAVMAVVAAMALVVAAC